ncbi:MAG: intradiol ring-cleavage dioxygenase [Acidimicrobiia bacterium]|jgi:protocatechuate 3,4-dioxygenase beta subunit
MSTPLSPHPSRRQVLTLLGGLGGIGLLTVAGCGGSDSSSAAATGAKKGAGSGSSTGTTATTGSAAATTPATAATSCTEVPQETAGPYPGDGSNGPDVLTQNGVVRSDLRSSFGSASGSVGGVPLTMKVTVLDLKNGCTPLAGAALYAWHCDADGRYSMYSQGVTNENWLRGVQATDANGTVTFTTVFPGAYLGRWPHVHFEVYPTLAAATSAGTKLTTSQLAMPEDACNLAYATSGYAASQRNFPQTTLNGDMVFRDGVSQQLATVTGTPAAGMVSNLTIAV